MDRETTDEIKPHFNVVAEDLRSEIRMVAESLVATNERIDRVEVRLTGEIGEVRALLRVSFADLDRRISSLDSRFSS